MRVLVLVCSFGLALGACTSGTETGNPVAAELTVVAHSTDPDAVGLEAGAGVVIDEAWVALAEVRFWPAGACDDDAMARAVTAETAGEVVSGIAFGDLVEISATEAYCRVEVPLHPIDALPAGAPPLLSGSTMVITGTRADGAPFRIVSAMVLRAGIRSAIDRFEVPAEPPSLLAGLDVAVWLAGIDLGSLPTEPDGTVLVDATHNAGALAAFEANVLASADLFHDDDEDGHVDPGETVLATHH